MTRSPYLLDTFLSSVRPGVLITTLLLANVAFNIVANASFKLSALSGSWKPFLSWQVIGNLAGFLTVITLTWLLRYIPLHVAFTVTTGLAVLGVQLGASAWIFHEPISRGQWLGSLLVVAGIVLVGRPTS
jgi:multidrug transporter EmrE-like cation transporter